MTTEKEKTKKGRITENERRFIFLIVIVFIFAVSVIIVTDKILITDLAQLPSEDAPLDRDVKADT